MDPRMLRKGTIILALAVMACSFGEVSATDRAGTASFPIGSAGIVVPLNPPMPTANYAVSVQPTNAAGYSPTFFCTYFNVLHKTPSQFEVQHKTCRGGTAKALDDPVSLDWQVSQIPVLGDPCGSGIVPASYHEHCGVGGNPTPPLVCADDTISSGATCTDDSNCSANLPLCVGTAACGSNNHCYKLAP